MNQIVSEPPKMVGVPGLAITQPHSLERSTPKTNRPKADDRQRGPDQVDPARLRRHVVDLAQHGQDGQHDDDLAEEDVPPGRVGGDGAADQRAGRDRHRARGRDQSVGGGAFVGREVGRDQSHDGRHDQRRADALQERPADQQLGEVLRDAGGERPGRVDHQADAHRLAAPHDGAELAAGDHQRGHHQRVQRDRGLDAGDRGAQVGRDRGHGHVHHGTVQGHQELAAGQHGQHQTGAGLCGCR